MKKTTLTVETRLDKIHQDLRCPICDQPMVHYRLWGYRCSNPEHNDRILENELRKAIRRSKWPR